MGAAVSRPAASVTRPGSAASHVPPMPAQPHHPLEQSAGTCCGRCRLLGNGECWRSGAARPAAACCPPRPRAAQAITPAAKVGAPVQPPRSGLRDGPAESRLEFLGDAVKPGGPSPNAKAGKDELTSSAPGDAWRAASAAPAHLALWGFPAVRPAPPWNTALSIIRFPGGSHKPPEFWSRLQPSQFLLAAVAGAKRTGSPVRFLPAGDYRVMTPRVRAGISDRLLRWR
jgi:hypothetical protein